jgi:hypothetical protein
VNAWSIEHQHIFLSAKPPASFKTNINSAKAPASQHLGMLKSRKHTQKMVDFRFYHQAFVDPERQHIVHLNDIHFVEIKLY